MTTGHTLPRITSVTSMSSQPQHQLLPGDMMPPHRFQEPASWNIPGTSRGGMPSQHGGSLLPDQFIPPVPLPPQDRLHPAPHPMPVALARHGDQGVVMGGEEMAELDEEEGEMLVSEEVLAAMPVATEMGELSPADLQMDGVDVSEKSCF